MNLKHHVRQDEIHPYGGSPDEGKSEAWFGEWTEISHDYCSICRRPCGVFRFKNDYFSGVYCRGCMLMFYYDFQDLLEVEGEMPPGDGNQSANSNIRKYERTKLTLDRRIAMLKESRKY